MPARTEFKSHISAPTISTSFDFPDLVKERLMCNVLSKHSPDHYVLFLSRSLVGSRHRCVIMHEVMHTRTDKRAGG